jgi:chaperone modulatory protein CbpM
MANEQEDAVWLHARSRITIVELAQFSGLREEVLRELVEYGALSPADPQAPEPHFNADRVPSVRAAARLYNDLELEMPALALVLSFLDRIEELETRLRELKAQLALPSR